MMIPPAVAHYKAGGGTLKFSIKNFNISENVHYNNFVASFGDTSTKSPG